MQVLNLPLQCSDRFEVKLLLTTARSSLFWIPTVLGSDRESQAAAVRPETAALSSISYTQPGGKARIMLSLMLWPSKGRHPVSDPCPDYELDESRSTVSQGAAIRACTLDTSGGLKYQELRSAAQADTYYHCTCTSA